jgi:hypothetical protein
MEEISRIYPQYTVYSRPSNNSNNSKLYTVDQVSKFVEQLDKRVYVNPQFKPFYCKATLMLGFERINEIMQMVITDPRIDSPELFCAERIFFARLRSEMKAKKEPVATLA